MMRYSFKTDKNSMAVVFHSLLNNSNLNDWERGFVDSINNKFTAGINLTENQMKKLSDIWEKY